MARRYNINWRDKDVKELQRVVRNFNAKIGRISKKEPSRIPFLPDRISVVELRDKIKTRQDFNREVNSIKRFSRRGAEDLKKITNTIERIEPDGRSVTREVQYYVTEYEFQEAAIKRRVVNRKRKAKLESIDISIEEGTAGAVESEALRPVRPLEDIKSVDEFERQVRVLEKEVMSMFDLERDMEYRENYYAAARNALGDYADELIEFLDNIDTQFFVENAISNRFLDIGFVYKDFDAFDKVDQIMSEWEYIYSNELGIDYWETYYPDGGGR